MQGSMMFTCNFGDNRNIFLLEIQHMSLKMKENLSRKKEN